MKAMSAGLECAAAFWCSIDDYGSKPAATYLDKSGICNFCPCRNPAPERQMGGKPFCATLHHTL